MVYANTTTKRDQVLEALRLNMDAIAPPTYANDVKRALVFRAQQLALGGEMPAVAIVPTDEGRVRALICAEDEYRMTVEILGVIRVDPSSTAWASQTHLMLGDIQQAIANDRQLGGAAVYVEVESTDIADAEVLGMRAMGMALVTATIVYRVSVLDVTV